MPTLSLYNNISADQLLSQENGKNIQDTICYKNIPMIRKPDYIRLNHNDLFTGIIPAEVFIMLQ